MIDIRAYNVGKFVWQAGRIGFQYILQASYRCFGKHAHATYTLSRITRTNLSTT